MLDKSIPFYHVVMKREQGTPIPNFPLPEGFHFVFFTAGDEKEWAEIETSVDEFDRAVDALVFFQERFLPYLEELERRCLFIENGSGQKIATLSMWWDYTGTRRTPRIHWVAVRPEYQGLGLGKAIVAEGLRCITEIEGDRDIYLHTQTWSYRAIAVYQKTGFAFTDERGVGGYANDDYEKARELLKQYLKQD